MSLIGKKCTVGGVVYGTFKAGRNPDRIGESDEMCYEHSTHKPCAFLKDGKCNKPADAPQCFSLDGRASAVFKMIGVDVYACEFEALDRDVKCFSCGCVIPGKGTMLNVAEELKETGAAHFIYKYRYNGEEGERHVCCLCELIAGALGRRNDFAEGQYEPRHLDENARKAKDKIIREFRNGTSLADLLEKYVWNDNGNKKELK